MNPEGLRILRVALRGFQALVARLPLLAMGLAATASIYFGANAIGHVFGNRLANAGRMAADREVVRGGELTGSLFEDLANAGLVRFDQKRLAFRAGVDCAARRAGFDVESGGAAANEFCETDPGVAIRREIEGWNAQMRIVAVRDNREQGLACNDGAQPVNYVPRGCHANRWTAAVADAPGLHPAFATVEDGEDPAPETYGFLARDPVEGQGDWRRFAGFVEAGAVVQMRSRLEVEGAGRGGERLVSIDYVGELVGAEALRDNAPKADAPALPVAPVSAAVMCENFRTSARCVREIAEQPGAALPRAGRVQFRLAAGWRGMVAIKVKPVAAAPASIRKLAKAEFVSPRDGEGAIPGSAETIRLSTHVLARCRRLNPDAIIVGEGTESDIVAPNLPNDAADPVQTCALDWEPSGFSDGVKGSGETDAPVRRIARIRLGGEGVALSAEAQAVRDGKSEPRAVASAAATELGLVPIIGLDDYDQFGLLGQMRTKIPAEGGESTLDLTLDPDIQRIVHSTLAGVMRREAAYRGIAAQLLPGHGEDRRGAIILLDAGPAPDARGPDLDRQGGVATGRILAVSTWPQPRLGLAEWDLRAMDAFRPSQSPLAARAWSQNDRLYAPGSTFKLVVALAAIERAATGDEKVAAYLAADESHKGMTADQLDQEIGNEFGFGMKVRELKVQKSNGPESHLIKNRGAALCQHTAEGCREGARLRLVDMLAQSDNLYFARLSLLLDADAVSTKTPSGRVEIREAPPQDGQQPPLAVAAMAQRLWPASSIELLPGFGPSRFSRLQPTPIQVDAPLLDRPRLLTVALNGMGQSAQATPLAMAAVAATIADGARVAPRLSGTVAGQGQGEPIFGADARTASKADAMLDTLRQGMKAVILRGTASGAFADRNKGDPTGESLRKRVWGKTGTAQIGNPEVDGNTVWFAGWIDGLRAKGFEGRRVAFACMITHANVTGAGGGSVCAPVMRMVLERIEAAAAQPGESNAAPFR